MAYLCIPKIHHPIFKKYEPLFDKAVKKRDSFPYQSLEWRKAQQEVGKYYDLLYSDGYFHDSFNFLCTLDLSWSRDVVPLLNKKRELGGKNLERFRDWIVTTVQHLPTEEELLMKGIKLKETGENSLEEWHRYFIEKRARLLAFLDQAIASSYPIRGSL